MPHTNRKKKPSNGKAQSDVKRKFSHSKREYINSQDGWTHVADRRWKSMTGTGKAYTVLENPLAGMTLEEMVKEHEQYRQQWESSDACTQLKIILSDTMDSERLIVENGICLGLGSLQALPMEWRRSSHTQLAALMTIMNTLNLTGQVIMQDPRFTDLDKLLLASMGCEVVDHPQAFEHINQKSLVYAVHCAFKLLWNVKEKADPALLIVNSLRDRRLEEIMHDHEVPDQPREDTEISDQTEDDKVESYLELYEKTCSLKNDCEEINFPQLRNDFSDTMIYWRCSKHAPSTGKPSIKLPESFNIA